MKLDRWAFAAVALPVVALCVGIADAELQRAQSKTFRFKVSGYDPRDLLRATHTRKFARLLTRPRLAAVVVAMIAVDHATKSKPKVHLIRLPIANVHLVIGEKVIVFDTGGAGSADDIIEAMAHVGISPKKVSLILLSHGHAGHAGGSLELAARTGAPVAVGVGDLAMVKNGKNRTLPPMSVFARFLRLFLADKYPAHAPAIVIDDELDLRKYGVAGKAVLFPGHTGGSVAILLPENVALVGDLMLGGWWGALSVPTHRASTTTTRTAPRCAATSRRCCSVARASSTSVTADLSTQRTSRTRWPTAISGPRSRCRQVSR